MTDEPLNHALTAYGAESRTAIALAVVAKEVSAEISAGKDRLSAMMRSIGAKTLIAEIDGQEVGTVSRQKGRVGGVEVVNETALKAHLREYVAHALVDAIDPVWLDAHLEAHAEEWATKEGEYPPGVAPRKDGKEQIVIRPARHARGVVLDAMMAGKLPLLPPRKTESETIE